MINDSSLWIKGKNFKLKNGTELKNISLDFITEKSELSYNLFTKVFSQKVYDMAVQLYSIGKDYEDMDDYDLFISLFITYYVGEYKNDEFISIVDEFFISKEGLDVIVNEIDEILVIDIASKKIVIDKYIYEEISSLMRYITNFKTKKVEKFANKYTKKMHFENLLEELEDRDDSDDKTITLTSLINAIILRTSYTYDTIFNLNMFQFHSLIDSIMKDEEWSNMMLGVYTGNIDAKKTNLNNYYWLLK